MIEQTADLWSFSGTDADAICITTNGTIKANGEAVMGRGCAREARDQNPAIDRILGNAIAIRGNRPHLLRRRVTTTQPPNLVSFPVKHHWYEKADIELIRQSAQSLALMATHHGWRKVILPRPGCGNGQLDWDDVKPVIEPLLDDRFVVVTK